MNRSRVRPRRQADWDRLFARRSLGDAAREVAGSLGIDDLSVEGEEGGVVRLVSATAGPEALIAAIEIVEAWRAARAAAARTEARLEARSFELRTLQSLGWRYAKARSVRDLFATFAELAEEAGGFECVIGIHEPAGSPVAHAHLARPVGEGVIESLVRGASGRDPAVVDTVRTRGFDERRGTLGEVREDETLVLPIVRRGRPAAHVVVVSGTTAGEAAMRLLWGAANQLAVHLDRILSVQEAEEGRFRSVLESMPQAVFLTDREHRVILANPAADSLLRRLPEGLPGTLAGNEPSDDSAPEGGAPGPCEVRLDDGTRLEVTVSPLRDAAGGVEGFVVVASDVTEARRLQEHLAQAEKMTSLGQMLSGVAHELNNPLAAVLGYAQLVRSLATAADEKTRQRLDLILQEARRSQRIVRNLLRFARHHEPERKPLSLNEVVDAVVGLMDYQLRVDGIAVEVVKDPGLPSIRGDVHELQQALLNLITNAHQAMREAGRAGGTIRIRTVRSEGGGVALEVADDGPGVPETIASRVFDPFFTTKEPGKGTGLGLSLVYGAIAAHGGTIRLDSREGEGARFHIELPVGAPPASERATRRREPEATSRLGVSASILVVDDEAAVASLICDALNADGHRAESVSDGTRALARLAQDEFDVVLTDYRMPGMDGERLRTEMERVRPGSSSRIVLTTGDTVSREPEAVAKRLGIELLHKPFDLDELRRVVRNRIERARER